jgi:hypothetical protein
MTIPLTDNGSGDWLSEPGRGIAQADESQIASEKVVTQIFTSWNPLTSWLRQLDRLRHAAA